MHIHAQGSKKIDHLVDRVHQIFAGLPHLSSHWTGCPPRSNADLGLVHQILFRSIFLTGENDVQLRKKNFEPLMYLSSGCPRYGKIRKFRKELWRVYPYRKISGNFIIRANIREKSGNFIVVREKQGIFKMKFINHHLICRYWLKSFHFRN